MSRKHKVSQEEKDASMESHLESLRPMTQLVLAAVAETISPYGWGGGEYSSSSVIWPDEVRNMITSKAFATAAGKNGNGFGGAFSALVKAKILRHGKGKGAKSTVPSAHSRIVHPFNLTKYGKQLIEYVSDMGVPCSRATTPRPVWHGDFKVAA